MLRKALLDALDTVDPARSSNIIVPQLTHFWFRGDRLMAYNDHIAIAVPFETKFQCAVPDMLHKLLRATHTKEVEFADIKGGMQFKAGRTKADLPTMGPEVFGFDIPKLKGATVLPFKLDDFIAALTVCMHSLSDDTSVPDSTGVTLIPGKNVLHAFTTNSITMTSAKIKLTGPLEIAKRIILSGPFCKQLLRLISKSSKVKLQVTDEYALAQVDDVMVFGRLIESQRPLEFQKILAAHLVHDDDFIDVSSKIKFMVERAVIAAGGGAERVRTLLTVAKGTLHLVTSPASGVEVADSAAIDPNHPDAELKVPAEWLKLGTEHFDRIVITPEVVLMNKGGAYFMIAGRA